MPLLLLPVRVETRYTADRQHLRIRIYPDQVHLDTTAMAPTAAELDHARTFWTMRHADPRGETQTFRWLVDRVGNRRAGYLARLTKPTKTDAGLTFPDITPQQVDTPARVRLMPDHFIAIGWHGDNEIFRVAGNPVSDDLVASPDPTRAGVTIDANGLRTDPGMSWMFDYDVAVERGMAITVDLAGKTGLAEVTTLLVLGVDATDPDTGAKGLAALLAAHQRAGDFAFVPQGTPTNNTDSVAAGYTRHERELADLERRELGDPVRTRLAWDNAERFAIALGLPDAAPYRHAAFGDDTELLRSRAMRAALFEATLGTFIRLALPLHGGGQLVQRVLPPLRKWFIDEVTARRTDPVDPHPQPALRHRAGRRAGGAGSDGPHCVKVRDVVDLLRNEWRFAAGGVVRLDHDAVDATGTFTPDDIGIVLAGEPHPVEFAARGAEEFDTVETSGPFVPTGMYLIGGDGETVFYEWQDGYRGEWDEGLAALLEDTPHVHEELETFLAQYTETTGIEGQLSRWLAFRDHVAVLSEPQETDGGGIQSWRYLPEAVAALPVIDDQLVQLWAHERRQRPVRWLGIEPYAGVLGENNNQLLLTRFDASTKAVQRALVEERDAPANGRAAGYLSALQTHRAGGTDPYPVPDDAALLHQLVGQTVHHLRTADIPCLATLAAVDAADARMACARDARVGHPPARRLGHERGDPAVARAALPRTRPHSGLAGRFARPTWAGSTSAPSGGSPASARGTRPPAKASCTRRRWATPRRRRSCARRGRPAAKVRRWPPPPWTSRAPASARRSGCSTVCATGKRSATCSATASSATSTPSTSMPSSPRSVTPSAPARSHPTPLPKTRSTGSKRSSCGGRARSTTGGRWPTTRYRPMRRRRPSPSDSGCSSSPSTRSTTRRCSRPPTSWSRATSTAPVPSSPRWATSTSPRQNWSPNAPRPRGPPSITG